MAYALPDKPSIAVLPFVNMSDDPKQEFFSDGITEEIITALSKIPQFFVIARNSTFTYKGKAVKIKQVSEELGVQYVLEGSVRRDGDRVRITAQLIDGLSGKHLWAERYDGDLKDIFALQDEITMKIITELRGKMVLSARFGLPLLEARARRIMEAYLKNLQAAEYLSRLTKDEAIQARKLCEEVIALDPEYSQGLLSAGLRFSAGRYVWKNRFSAAGQRPCHGIDRKSHLPGSGGWLLLRPERHDSRADATV